MSHIQIDELNRTTDEERRARLFLKFASTIQTVIPTETFVFGKSRLGYAKLSNGSLFSSIRQHLDQLNNSKPNNVNDALIAEAAIKNKYTLITSDYHLNKVAIQHGCSVIYEQN